MRNIRLRFWSGPMKYLQEADMEIIRRTWPTAHVWAGTENVYAENIPAPVLDHWEALRYLRAQILCANPLSYRADTIVSPENWKFVWRVMED